MNQWYFTKDELQDTPTILDGRTFEEEQIDRIKGCHYLLSVGAKLNLPQLVVVTATTYFHRFFMRQSMARFHVYDIAATCLFVATKVEECTRRLKDIIIACAQKGQKNDKLKLEEDSKDFIRWKETLLFNEIIVLETLCFDFTVEHPHLHLFELESELQVSPSSIRKAWMLLYQSLGAPLCLLYKPRIVAAAALLLATNLSNSDKLNENWFENLKDINVGQVYELAVEMLEHYREHYLVKSSSSSSQLNSPHPSQIHHTTNGY
ncbi:cyclin-like protein [Cokeromyces recurvatus]|uniref:cyclin-like protein n=1 Tax=Cokeromyces recurvatus TaxID=90255 RepID=UPI00221F1760|nr:cyclin-like protein [Cokeromyces recurvatus]KAI7905952.1 cyclin-like protein [Cokeromyces recurvatus]